MYRVAISNEKESYREVSLLFSDLEVLKEFLNIIYVNNLERLNVSIKEEDDEF